MRRYKMKHQNVSSFDESMPLIGPATMEEALERIDSGLREMECGGGYSWEEVREDILQSKAVYAG